MLLLLLAAACLAAAAYAVGEFVTSPGRQRQISLRRARSYGRVRLPSVVDRRHFSQRVVLPMAGRLASVALRLSPKSSVEAIQLKLLAAGLSQRVQPQAFLAIKGGLGFSGLVIGFSAGLSKGPGHGFLFLLLFGACGFMLPDVLLTSKARARREAIRSQLPDALDLLAVSVEAGMGFDGAISKLTEHLDGALVDEFTMTLGEMRIGENRQDALKKMADRVQAPEMSAFVRSIVQADQLGISLGRILRVQAADTRLRRQATAEERAMKAPIKMLFPTVLFIFPAMFLVILGPAMLNLSKIF
jgi:tight adherence protein C